MGVRPFSAPTIRMVLTLMPSLTMIIEFRLFGALGAGGQIKDERYDAKAPALAALRLQAARKQRRSYATTDSCSDN
jgi:hypothetical protein